jgi:hypothetical protein
MAHMFDTQARAKAFADKKNRRVRKGKWVVQRGGGGGYVAWHRKTPGQQLFYSPKRQ